MQQLRKLAFAIALALCIAPAILSAHLKFVRSAPAADATIEASPAELRLWFSEEPLLPMSGVTLSGPKGAVKLPPPKAGGDQSLVVTLDAPLEPGAYKISWKAAGDDGHVLQGTVGFTIKPKAQLSK
jgi:methionine-rich copper-binding protein CopC